MLVSVSSHAFTVKKISHPQTWLHASRAQHGMLVFHHVSAPAVDMHPVCFYHDMKMHCMLMQALLSQYVAMHHEHSSMLSQLLDQLRQYGYQAEYKGPLAMEPMQLLGITEPQQARSLSPHAGHITIWCADCSYMALQVLEYWASGQGAYQEISVSSSKDSTMSTCAWSIGNGAPPIQCSTSHEGCHADEVL